VATSARPARRPLHLVVCDARPIVRAGLAVLCDGLGPVRTCVPADLGATLAEAPCDVVIVGVGGEGPARFDPVLEAGGAEGPRSIALLDHLDEAELRAAVVAGAQGVLPSDVGPEALLDALARVRSGEQVGPSFDEPARPDPGPGRPLRPVELRVLELMSEGLTNEGIAARLDLAPRTVKTHVQNLIVRLDARDRTSAVARALRSGLIR
jgi:DNA-binding NarL/FixJ family response regulator